MLHRQDIVLRSVFRLGSRPGRNPGFIHKERAKRGKYLLPSRKKLQQIHVIEMRPILTWVSGGYMRRSFFEFLLVLSFSSPCCGSIKRRGYRPLNKNVALIKVALLCRGFAALASKEQGEGAGCVGYNPATKSRG
jgi:hypothetical protein